MLSQDTARLAGYCIRCREPFHRDTSAIMTFEFDTPYQLQDRVVEINGWVAVCHNCAEPSELAAVASASPQTCLSCGQRFLAPRRLDRYGVPDMFVGNWGRWSTVRLRFCSTRCDQRYRRLMKKARRPTIQCKTCKQPFQPTRTDAKFCSPGCRQWAYRLRRLLSSPAKAPTAP